MRRYTIETYRELATFAKGGHGTDNHNRAARGAGALFRYIERGGNDVDFEEQLSDLLTDLMHLADVLQVDFNLALDRARRHHDAEHYEEEVSGQ